MDCGKLTRVFELFTENTLLCPTCYREIVEAILENAEEGSDASPADGA